MKEMVGFVQMSREKLYGKMLELGKNWKNMVKEWGNIWKMDQYRLCHEGIISWSVL